MLYLVPAPADLNANQWHYFAVFAAVIAGLVLESMPGGGRAHRAHVCRRDALCRVRPIKYLRWALSGFSESTVWLIVGAFVFAIAYRKSGLGRRIALLLVRGTLLCIYSLGLMGVISPYATGPAPMYYGGGFIGKGDFWKFGLIFGVIYFVGLLVIVLPWLRMGG